ncbi:MAG: hypothetical protein P1Q69_18955, partial [Candidatus Thorarchaeota archaeon]|nr:hypothetical protein [Candidatus Thorarchaeota archaeon]
MKYIKHYCEEIRVYKSNIGVTDNIPKKHVFGVRIVCGEWVRWFNEVKQRRIEMCIDLATEGNLGSAIERQRKTLDSFDKLDEHTGMPWTEDSWNAARDFENGFYLLLEKILNAKGKQTQDFLREVNDIVFNILIQSLVQTMENLWLAARRDLDVLELVISSLASWCDNQEACPIDLKTILETALESCRLFQEFTKAFRGSDTPGIALMMAKNYVGLLESSEKEQFSEDQKKLLIAFALLMKALAFGAAGSIRSYEDGKSLDSSDQLYELYKILPELESTGYDPSEIADLGLISFETASEAFKSAKYEKWRNWALTRSLNQSAWSAYKSAEGTLAQAEEKRSRGALSPIDYQAYEKLVGVSQDYYNSAKIFFSKAAKNCSKRDRYKYVEDARASRSEAQAEFSKFCLTDS